MARPAGRFLCMLLLSCAGAMAGGCGVSSLTSGLGGGVFGGSSTAKSEVKTVNEDQLLTAAKSDSATTTGSTSVGEVNAGCPRFLVWPRDNHLTIYEQGRAGDGLAIMHRGEITKLARECQVQQGRVTVKYGFSGRVLLGPRGKSGNVSLPFNVFVTDAKREKIAADSLKLDVSVAVENPIGYFSAVRSVTFDIPQGARAGDFEVFVGFDQKTAGAG